MVFQHRNDFNYCQDAANGLEQILADDPDYDYESLIHEVWDRIAPDGRKEMARRDPILRSSIKVL